MIKKIFLKTIIKNTKLLMNCILLLTLKSESNVIKFLKIIP